LPFDSAAAREYAEIAAARRRAGRPISEADARIAAIARSRGAALATRNVQDFAGCELQVIDPWL
jgi:predicted nucleic acid-binding protein